MSVLVDSSSRVLVQNITGREGSVHTRLMQAYGTNVVAGTALGRKCEEFEGVPVFEFVRRRSRLPVQIRRSSLFPPPLPTMLSSRRPTTASV